MNEIKPETDRKKLPVIIKVHGDENLSAQVQKILLTIGVSFNSSKKIVMEYKSLVLLVSWNKYPEPYLYHDTTPEAADRYIKDKPHALVFDARTQMV